MDVRKYHDNPCCVIFFLYDPDESGGGPIRAMVWDTEWTSYTRVCPRCSQPQPATSSRRRPRLLTKSILTDHRPHDFATWPTVDDWLCPRCHVSTEGRNVRLWCCGVPMCDDCARTTVSCTACHRPVRLEERLRDQLGSREWILPSFNLRAVPGDMQIVRDEFWKPTN